MNFCGAVIYAFIVVLKIKTMLKLKKSEYSSRLLCDEGFEECEEDSKAVSYDIPHKLRTEYKKSGQKILHETLCPCCKQIAEVKRDLFQYFVGELKCKDKVFEEFKISFEVHNRSMQYFCIDLSLEYITAQFLDVGIISKADKSRKRFLGGHLPLEDPIDITGFEQPCLRVCPGHPSFYAALCSNVGDQHIECVWSFEDICRNFSTKFRFYIHNSKASPVSFTVSFAKSESAAAIPLKNVIITALDQENWFFLITLDKKELEGLSKRSSSKESRFVIEVTINSTKCRLIFPVKQMKVIKRSLSKFFHPNIFLYNYTGRYLEHLKIMELKEHKDFLKQTEDALMRPVEDRNWKSPEDLHQLVNQHLIRTRQLCERITVITILKHLYTKGDFEPINYETPAGFSSKNDTWGKMMDDKQSKIEEYMERAFQAEHSLVEKGDVVCDFILKKNAWKDDIKVWTTFKFITPKFI